METAPDAPAKHKKRGALLSLSGSICLNIYAKGRFLPEPP